VEIDDSTNPFCEGWVGVIKTVLKRLESGLIGDALVLSRRVDMVCASNRAMSFLLALVGGLLLYAIPGEALQPPRPGELQALSEQNPLEYQLRMERVLGLGNPNRFRHLLEASSARMKVLAAGGDPSGMVGALAAGTVKTNNTIVYLIDFPDHPHVNSYATITNKLFGTGDIAEYPRESLNEYYKRSSYGKEVFAGLVLPWYRTKRPRDYYTDKDEYLLINEVKAAHPEVDFSKYGYTLVFWAGPDNGWSNFWWGKNFGNLSWQWESNPVGSPFSAVVAIHESGHYLSLPDYYKYPNFPGTIGGLGGIDMMENNMNDHNCFSKFMLGWLTPTVVVTNLTQFPLRSTADFPEAIAMASGYDGSTVDGEYFMVQNRQPRLNDINLIGTGLMIWHVDTRYDTRNGFPLKGLKLMQADGLYEIEEGLSANAGDFFNKPSIFTPGSNPNSLSTDGSNTGVRVTNISGLPSTLKADYSVILNTTRFSPAGLSLAEGATATVAVTLAAMPPSDVTVAITRASGSTNLAFLGGVTNLNLVFTPANWETPQTIDIMAANDADDTNDTAVFTASGSVDLIIPASLAVQQIDAGDKIPPHCTLTARVTADRREVVFDFVFDDAAMGFDTNDLVATDNVYGGIELISFMDYTPYPGSNLHFQATYAVPGSPYGAITLTVPAGSYTDVNGNSSEAFQLSYTMPYVKRDFEDNFDGPTSPWIASTNDYATLTTDGWMWGPPTFDALTWKGPDAAVSGPNCWGMMKGPYPFNVNAWVESPSFYVGINPTVHFKRWQDKAAAFVEVFDGSGWRNVTPGGYFDTTITNFYPVIAPPVWLSQGIALDTAIFGNRMIKIRFRARDCAMYVDDVFVESERPASVWAVECSPGSGAAGTSVPLSFWMYNSGTTPVSNITGLVNTSDAGVINISGVPLMYPALQPGEIMLSDNSLLIDLGEASRFSSPLVLFNHVTRTNGVAASDNALPFMVTNVVSGLATNLLTVKATGGVTNWLGQFLKGNGDPSSCLYQVIAAGSNGVADLPGAEGQMTGDDRLLYNVDVGQPFGRFGEAVPVDKGQFIKTFYSGLASNDVVYIRAWEGSALESAVAYGDSTTATVSGAAVEVLDFGGWGVTNPASTDRDFDGDSILDSWCVQHGVDARRPIQSLGSVTLGGLAQTNFSLPSRLAVSSNFVFVADTGNDRVQVWDRALTNRWFVLGVPLGSEFRKPAGIAVNRDESRVAVADTENSRVRVFSVNPSNGVLTALTNFGSVGSGVGQFMQPMAVAFDASNLVYVADSHPNEACNKRIQIFDSMGAFQEVFGTAGTNSGEFGRVMGVSLGSDGTVFEADGNNNRVQAFSGTTLLWSYGAGDSPSGSFNWAWDVQPGLGGHVYAADFNNNRIQVLRSMNSTTVSVSGVYANAGPLGSFSLPKCAVSAANGTELYVADTYNNRVLRLSVTLDADRDGMDDNWETLHGLDPANAADALQDPDRDGLLNIGEYRAQTDPAKWDSYEIAAFVLSIRNFVINQRILNWQARSGDIYHVQSSTNLILGDWAFESAVTSPANDLLSVTNAFTGSNWLEFFRVIQTNVP
jgi:M6 family metalloprotease-like protein